MRDNRSAVAMLLAAAIFWSTSGVLIKLVALHPAAIAGWRSLIAGVVILLLCRRTVTVSWKIEPLLAAGCMGLFCICFVIATKLTTAANAIVLQYAASVYVAVLAPRMLGEPTRRQDWYFLLLVIAGIGLFFLDDLSLQGTTGILIGVVLIFVLKDIVKIVINSILGLLILFMVNYFDLMGYVGRPDIEYTPVNIILCALGGIPGTLIVIIMQLLGHPVG